MDKPQFGIWLEETATMLNRITTKLKKKKKITDKDTAFLIKIFPVYYEELE